MIRTILLCAALASTPVLAQEAAPTGTAAQMAEARSAEETARLMAAVQSASAVAQQQFAGMTDAALTAGFRGAVAFPGEDLGVWNVVLVAARGEGATAPLVALAEYEVAESEILSETLHDPANAPALTGTALHMARAKYVAPRAVIAAPSAGICLDGEPAAQSATRSVSYIALVLPPEESGAIEAYVLNGPIAEGAVPLGKHYRVRFDEFGQVGEPEVVTDTCEVVTWNPGDSDLSTLVHVTRHEIGDAPNAVHAFLSTQVPIQLAVVTGELVWSVRNGMIAPPAPLATAGD